MLLFRTSASAALTLWKIFTDFTLILGFMLGKKIFTALVKNLLNGQFNAVANIVVYSLEFVIFWLYRPFRDNMVRVLSLPGGLTTFPWHGD